MSENAAGFVGSIPDEYDRGLGPLIFADYADDMARRLAAARPARVLEVAAGTGIVTRRLRDLLAADAHLTATDLNPPMLALARTKIRPGERVAFQPADATALPFPDGAFDAVACQFGVMFFPDKAASFREARRVLAPGGRYVFSVWDANRHNPFARIAQEVTTSFFPADPPSFYEVPFGYHRIDPIKDALLEAGFQGVQIAVVRVEKDVPSAAAFARGLVFGNPLAEQVRARGGDPDRVVAAVGEALRREFGPDPGRMRLQAIVFEAARDQGDRG
ncbi:MAG: class I SAM-dependent methyltransferase [Acetobacteraceae bacterium]|nr:class I SAM-dependent methyltransferase [Acetobacteraceae bacterium]